MIVELTRHLVAYAAWFSGSIAILRCQTVPRLWRPHLWFIAFWSFVFGFGMFALAVNLGWAAEVLLPSINVAAFCSLFGWATFALRYDVNARRIIKQGKWDFEHPIMPTEYNDN